MKKFIAAALLGVALFTAAPANAETPSVTSLLTQAQTMLTTDASGAASLFEQAAALGASVTTTNASDVTAIVNALVAWASNPANQAANPTAASSIFMSALTLSGTPAITAANPNLYSNVLAAAQEFTNKGPKDNQKLAELEGALNLAIGLGNPNTNGLRNTPPTDD